MGENIKEAAENYKINIIKSGRSHRVEYTQQIKLDFIAGIKWQRERSYSEEEVIELIEKAIEDKWANLRYWFNQFKKK